MNDKKHISGPIAVGGIGGSGTRLLAEILIQLGFFMGLDLNSANDNLGFTFLFKRPKWFIKMSNKKQSEIFKGLSIFEKAMTGCLVPKINELHFIMRSAVEVAINGHDHLHSGRGIWAIERAINILKLENIDISRYIGWGWKEPNTHIFIEYLAKYFDHMRYIHVIRNGLDMAYSSNQAQLYNWGKIFGIVPNSSMPLPKLSLQYWINANKRAVSVGHKLFNERFLLINFDRFCIDPRHQIGLLIAFLGLDSKSVNIDRLMSIPKIPNSSGRYKKHDISVFSEEELRAVQDLGFGPSL
jgi:hypothetical protein